MYIVSKSVEGVGNQELGERESFDDAVELAEDKGAKGSPVPSGRNLWCFSGGPESVGYWITQA